MDACKCARRVKAKDGLSKSYDITVLCKARLLRYARNDKMYIVRRIRDIHPIFFILNFENQNQGFKIHRT